LWEPSPSSVARTMLLAAYLSLLLLRFFFFSISFVAFLPFSRFLRRAGALLCARLYFYVEGSFPVNLLPLSPPMAAPSAENLSVFVPFQRKESLLCGSFLSPYSTLPTRRPLPPGRIPQTLPFFACELMVPLPFSFLLRILSTYPARRTPLFSRLSPDHLSPQTLLIYEYRGSRPHFPHSHIVGCARSLIFPKPQPPFGQHPQFPPCRRRYFAHIPPPPYDSEITNPTAMWSPSVDPPK